MAGTSNASSSKVRGNVRGSAPLDAETADRLRHSVTRLARMLRQQDDGAVGATAIGVLAGISRHGPSTPSEMAARERVAPPTITKVVEKLEALDLVVRHADDNDRRVTRITLTKSGREYLDRTRAARTDWLADRLARLAPDQLQHVPAAIDLLEAISDVEPVVPR